MSNLINPKPRFGYHPDSGRMYDYVVQRDVDLSDDYSAADGVWNLYAVRDAILANQTVEAGRVSGPAQVDEEAEAPPPPVANAGTVDAPVKPAKSKKAAAAAAGQQAALSVAQLIGLSLSALQCAALQITPAQLTATGVTAEQVKSWALNEERAAALQLTAAQRAVLMPS